jgi:hypothetical protein
LADPCGPAGVSTSPCGWTGANSTGLLLRLAGPCGPAGASTWQRTSPERIATAPGPSLRPGRRIVQRIILLLPRAAPAAWQGLCRSDCSFAWPRLCGPRAGRRILQLRPDGPGPCACGRPGLRIVERMTQAPAGCSRPAPASCPAFSNCRTDFF